MAFSHFKRLSGILGLWVGKAGAEVQVADASGNLSHGGTALLAATDLNRGALKKVTGALTANDGAGKVFSWANPETSDILIEHIALKVTTKTNGDCTVDVGTTTTNATTSSDNLIDGKDINAAAGTFTNIESAGTNGKSAQRLATGKWVTASTASGASAGLVGTYEIYYRVL
jgi:hypothetical protein